MANFRLPQFLDYHISVALYTEVKNSKDLHSHIADLPFAIVDARLICSEEHLFAAIYRVLIEKSYNRLRTKNLNSELLLCLSPSSNIGEAFKKFGLNPDSKSLICVQITHKDESLKDQNFGPYIEGIEQHLTTALLNSIYEENRIKELYKLDKAIAFESTDELSRAVVNSIMLRGL